MTGDKVKALRESKCWSQAHLAEAADLNIRTVQRIEAGEPCAPETMLALAAAMGVGVAELGPGMAVWSGQGRNERARLAIASALVFPAALFVIVNLLRSWAGIAWPYDRLADSGGQLMDFATFNRLSPLLFIGGAAAAVALSTTTFFRFRARRRRGVLSISGVDLLARPLGLAVAMVATLSGAALMLYAAAEQLHSRIF
jgi:transcriptional regulator with XRE-family HTH domain